MTQDVAHRALSTQSSVRTLQDVDQFLRSRRHTSTAGGVSSDHNRCHTVSDKDTKRLSKIFASKPLQTSSKT